MAKYLVQQLPHLEFFGVQNAVHLVPLDNDLLLQSTNAQVFLTGRIDPDPALDPGYNIQEVGYKVEVWSYDGNSQNFPQSTWLGAELNQLTHGLGGDPVEGTTGQLGLVHVGGVQFSFDDIIAPIGAWAPVIALKISKIYEETVPEGDPTLAGIPVYVTGQVLFEVE
jgi:hypothetical protein